MNKLLHLLEKYGYHLKRESQPSIEWSERNERMANRKESNQENILYHYCSVEAFFNIIKNAKLWLSDIEKSNDYRECITCKNILNEKIEEHLFKNHEELDLWKKGYDEGSEENSNIRTFGVCFSEREDQLSQWRGYAQDGKGLAIGFDKQELENLNLISEEYILFGKAFYSNVEDYVSDMVQDNINKIEDKGAYHVAFEMSQNYRLRFPFVKTSGFEEEKEWRACVCCSVKNSSTKNGNIPGSDRIIFQNMNYRISNDRLIPYIEMNFEKIKCDFIKKIFIGPRSKIEKEDIVEFLNFYGYYDCSDDYNSDEPIGIKKSSISYQ